MNKRQNLNLFRAIRTFRKLILIKAKNKKQKKIIFVIQPNITTFTVKKITVMCKDVSEES